MNANNKLPISVLYLNMRSLRNKMQDLEVLTVQKNCDIVIINEIWIKSHETSFYNLRNYHSIYNCRDQQEGGGCAIFIKNGIEFNVLSTEENFNLIIIGITIDSQILKIGTAYRPPLSNIPEFCEYLQRYIIVHTKLLFFGDVNINILEHNIRTTNYIDLLNNNGFQLLNTTVPTRVSYNGTATLIDHIITNIHLDNTNTTVEIEDTPISDHKQFTKNHKEPWFIKIFVVSTKKHFMKALKADLVYLHLHLSKT